MKKEKVKYSLVCAICLVFFVAIALFASANRSSDMIMPSVYIVDGMTIWYVMLLSIIAETAIVKWALKETYLKSASISMLMNLVSIVLGFVTLHIASLLVEVLFIPFSFGTFHISHWIVNFLFIVLLNASIEGLTVKLSFKLQFKKNFKWLCLANAISLAICFLLNLSWVEAMYFN